MSSRIILTAAEMRSAEAKAIEAGTSLETLMERAGTAAAEAIWRFAGPLPTLVLCGPGNNGGDGYVIARVLKERGVEVRVAALGEPQSPAAKAAREAWGGQVEPLDAAEPAPLLVDSLFGTGLTRALDASASSALNRLGAAGRVRVAVDLPSGVSTDDGAILSPVPDYDLTITFAAPKPSHFLQPAARNVGRVVVADIGVAVGGDLHLIGRPALKAPGPDDHKYRRGYVAVLGGDMPSASALAAAAASRAGAGFVRFFASQLVSTLPNAVVQSPGAQYAPDSRIGALVVGPGLGLGLTAREQLATAVVGATPLIIDADALNLLSQSAMPSFNGVPVLTPHAWEFERLFGTLPGSKIDRARAAAAQSGAVILYKGPDSVVAAPDGRAAIAPAAPHWLATAGTGDVLAGIAGAMRARGLEPFEAACAAAWLHSRAAQLAGPALIADDLIGRLPAALAECSE